MSPANFYRNMTLTAKSPTFPILAISAVILCTSYYLYRLYEIASLSPHYAFLYHVLASPFIVVPFALSVKEKNRFESLGYTYRWNTEASWIYACYCLLASISWAYMRAYGSEEGAFAEALYVLIGWFVLMGVNLVPLWLLATLREPKQAVKELST